jgi:large subunit ribosomal protein L24
MKYNIKSGSEVVVISGSHKGSRGKILQVQKNKNRVIVEGVAMRKKHVKKSQDNPEGAIQEREGSIHYSNVMLAERYDSRKKSKK